MFSVHAVLPSDRPAYRDVLDDMHRQRYAVFIERLGWDIPGVNHASKRETDYFDTKETIYLLVMRGKTLLGASRMNPTVSPHMMTDVFPHLCPDGVPTGDDVYEWSRGHVDPEQDHQTRSKTLDHIFVGGYVFALDYGIRHLTAQVNAGDLNRWLRRGLHVKPLGPPVLHKSGEALLAYVHTITRQTLATVRRDTGINTGIVRLAAHGERPPF